MAQKQSNLLELHAPPPPNKKIKARSAPGHAHIITKKNFEHDNSIALTTHCTDVVWESERSQKL